MIVTNLPVNAAESKNSIDDLKKIQNNIREKDPQKIKSEKLEKKSKDIQVSKQKDLDIEIDSSSKKVTVKHSKKGNTVIGVPNSDQLTDIQTIDNQVIFSGKNAKFDVVAEAIDGGMRQVVNIKDSSAPTTYDFPVSLEAGEKLDINDDGSAKVVSSKVDEVSKLPINKTTIDKPWAKDANGKELKTYYSINSSNLRQTIETKDVAFPITADPMWCGDVIWYTQWDYRPSEGGTTLKVYPTYCGRSGYIGDYFNEVINKTGSNPAWPSINRNIYNSQGYSMYNQFRCHAAFAWFFKESYNLEPWRPDVDWRTLVTRNLPWACNP
jgi:hypothetical protein